MGLEFIMNSSQTIIDGYTGFLDFMVNTVYTIGTNTFTLADVVLGAGLGLIVGYAIVAWIIDILP